MNSSDSATKPTPELYCNSCKIGFTAVSLYAIYMCKLHGIQTSDTFVKREKDLIPDATKPSNYCRSCKCAYKTFILYKEHLLNTHRMLLSPHTALSKKIPGVVYQVTDDGAKHFCYLCQKTYLQKGYKTHLRFGHKIYFEDKVIKNGIHFRVLPDPTEPDHYCRACQENYKGINDYRQHLQEYHKLILPPLIKKESLVTPEVVNINKAKINYCYECQRSHRLRLECKKHLTSVHKIGVPSSARRYVDKTIKPDPMIPTFTVSLAK